MALQKKPIKGSGAIKMRDVITANDGTTVQLTQTWVGPYAELKTKLEAVYLEAKSAALTPTEAGEGELVITYEQQLTADVSKRPPSVETIEVIWSELRQPVETAPAFIDLTADQIKKIRDAAEGPADEAQLPPDAGEAGGKLYDLLRKGTTEWVTGVPVIRRTTTNVQGNIAGGNAWFRDTPPDTPPGGWQFIKSADERRQVGYRFDQVEEWIGAKHWDETLYPP
jgi:hypothetical protein